MTSQPEVLDLAARWRLLGRRGATVWITGLPASGKSTLGSAIEDRLVRGGVGALRLDGDNLRHGLNGDRGFDAPDRAENVRRTAHVARLLAEAGDIAIVTRPEQGNAGPDQSRWPDGRRLIYSVSPRVTARLGRVRCAMRLRRIGVTASRMCFGATGPTVYLRGRLWESGGR